MKPPTGPVHRVRQFLAHTRSYGLGAATRRAGQFVSVRVRSMARGSEEGGHHLSWREFDAHFLSRRDIYKGVFVQNVVVEWSLPLFSRPHQMALALGRLGYLVVYKTPYPALDGVVGVRNVAPNVYLTGDDSFDCIDGAVHSVYSTSATHPPDWILDRSAPVHAIYEYVDHIDPKISGDEGSIGKLTAHKRHAFEEGRYDFIVASARKLEEEAVSAVGRDKVLLVPNGVDAWRYRNPIREDVPLPEAYLAFTNRYANVVGYFGAIAPWLWYDEIEKLARRRADLGFVFIGPDYFGSVGRLPRTANVLRLDAVDHQALPVYASQFDVCFIPFEPGEIARTTSPLKLFEYFALEKPVVVTAQMHECTSFKEVFSGDDARSLSGAIDDAVDLKSDRAFKGRLAQLADANSWDNRARLLERVFPSRSG